MPDTECWCCQEHGVCACEIVTADVTRNSGRVEHKPYCLRHNRVLMHDFDDGLSYDDIMDDLAYEIAQAAHPGGVAHTEEQG